ncbi:hypothetical protein [Acidimangrovimonas sediminis]|uniref:hypothetical protein n=1 Tax=Acidimangrovimonas sediminis TaxID=2056283 RepID=UPI000C7FFEFE|nr:hypothetical protein [Acidimangrovimonas sediminis]
MRTLKLAAVAAAALAVASPMAMANSFSRGTITSMNPVAGTVSIDGARYALDSGAAQGSFAVGDHVLVKTSTKGAMNSISRMLPQN